MLLISHVTTGAIIGQKLSHPAFIILLSFISHFILDRIPHWNYLDSKQDGKEYTEQESFSLWKYLAALPDIITGVLIYVLFLFSYPDQWLNISLGVCFAILPDFITFTKYIPSIKKIFRPINKLHFKAQGHIKKYKAFIGIFNQVIYFSILILILIYL